MSNGGDKADAPMPARPRLFFSYTRTDIDSARPIIAALQNAGYDVWWDGLLEGGVTYLPTTEAALEQADCVVVLWSQTSVNSNWVRDEAQSGRERGRLVPVSLDGTMAPLGFRQIQLIDISGCKGNPGPEEIGRILSAVGKLTGSGAGAGAEVAAPILASATPPPVKSLGLTRRQMAIGGLGIGAAGSLLGAWQFGLLPGGGGDSTVSIAVLGFANQTGDKDQAWFSEGLSSEMRQTLSRNPLLRVSAPASSAAVEDKDEFAIGRALGVQYVLRGSVQRAKDIVRISAELARVTDGLVRWGKTYDRKLTDVFAIQTEIAQMVAMQLVAQIVSVREAERTVKDQASIGGTNDILAYEAYLRGVTLSNLSAGLETDRASLAQFDAALAIDPAFAKAHAMRADLLAAIANSATEADEVAGLYEQSIAAAEQSIALEPALAAGHLALGFALNNGRIDRAAAFPHYQKAEKLAPGDADVQRSAAQFYAYGKQQKLALEMIDRVLTLDPLNARAFRTASFIALFARDYKRTIREAQKALKLSPGMASANYTKGVAQFVQGDLDSSQKAFEAEVVPIFSKVGLAIINAKRGDQAAAQQALDEMLAEYGDACLYQQTQVHAQWGDTAKAIELLDRAFAARDPGVLLAPNDALLDPLRKMAAFDRLLSPLMS